MPLDPQFRIVLDTFEGKGLTPLVRGDAAETRVHYRRLALSRRGPQYVPEPVASAADQRSPGGVPVRVYEPLNPGGSTLIYLHGGGWVVGDVETHDPLCRRVANATGARVVSVDYRLAPEHPFPAGLDDVEDVLHWLWTEDPARALGVAPAIVATAEFDPLARRADPAGRQLMPSRLRRTRACLPSSMFPAQAHPRLCRLPRRRRRRRRRPSPPSWTASPTGLDRLDIRPARATSRLFAGPRRARLVERRSHQPPAGGREPARRRTARPRAGPVARLTEHSCRLRQVLACGPLPSGPCGALGPWGARPGGRLGASTGAMGLPRARP